MPYVGMHAMYSYNNAGILLLLLLGANNKAYITVYITKTRNADQITYSKCIRRNDLNMIKKAVALQL